MDCADKVGLIEGGDHSPPPFEPASTSGASVGPVRKAVIEAVISLVWAILEVADAILVVIAAIWRHVDGLQVVLSVVVVKPRRQELLALGTRALDVVRALVQPLVALASDAPAVFAALALAFDILDRVANSM